MPPGEQKHYASSAAVTREGPPEDLPLRALSRPRDTARVAERTLAATRDRVYLRRLRLRVNRIRGGRLVVVPAIFVLVRQCLIRSRHQVNGAKRCAFGTDRDLARF